MSGSKTKTSSPRLITLLTWAKLYILVAVVALTPLLSQYLLNRYQVSVQELLLPVILDLLTALIISLIFYRLWRRDRLAAYVAATVTTIMFTTGYESRFNAILGPLQAILPLPTNIDLMYDLIFMAAIIGAAYWLGRTASVLTIRRQWPVKTLMMAASIAIGATFILQLIPTIKDLAVAWPQFFYQPPALAAAPAAAKTGAKPDIYYIIMDRYTSPDVLKSQFSYDDSQFTDFLKAHGYYVHSDAHQNYPYTTQSVASTVNANYNSDIINKFGSSTEQTVIPYNLTIRNSPVAQYLQSIGYNYSLIGNWYETSNISPVADQTYQEEGLFTLFNHTWILDNFEKNQLTSTIYNRFLGAGIKLGGLTLGKYRNTDSAQMTIDQLKTLQNLAATPGGGRFIFAHILVPHDPYFFNADGSLNPNSDGDNVGLPIKQKYLNQVTYINSQMEKILQQIEQTSQGQATVVLQSDEGAYPLDLNDQDFDQGDVEGELASGSMLSWSQPDLELKFSNFAAYHVPGASASELVAGGTSVNAFRLVFNTLFGQNLPYLPACYYAYPNGRDKPFYYKNINAQLTGQTDPVCADNGTGPTS